MDMHLYRCRPMLFLLLCLPVVFNLPHSDSPKSPPYSTTVRILDLPIWRGLVNSFISWLPEDSDSPCVAQLKAIVEGNPEQATALSNLMLYTAKNSGEMGNYRGCHDAGSRYILVNIQITPGIPSTTAIGLCAPINCTEDDYNQYLRPKLLPQLPGLLKMIGIPLVGRYWVDGDSLDFIDTYKRNEELTQVSGLATLFIVVSVLLGLVQITASIVDLGQGKGKLQAEALGPAAKVVQSLSLVRNVNAMVFGTCICGNNFNVFFGVQALMIMWLTTSHVCFYYSVTPTVNILDQNQEIQDNFGLQVLIAGEHAVDTLFFVTGFLATLTLTPLFLEAKWNLFGLFAKLVLRRYVKQFLMYAAVIVFVIAIVPLLHPESPLNVFNAWAKAGCVRDWVYNLLYVSNFAGPTYSCMQWSWYVAADMQFFIITPFILYSYHRSKAIGLIILAVLTAISLVANIATIISNEYTYSYLFVKVNQFDDYNVRPYTRVIPYLLGILGAWMYQSYTQKGAYTNRSFDRLLDAWMSKTVLRTVLYIVGLVFMFGNFYLTYVFDHHASGVHMYHNIIDLTFSRVFYALGVALILMPMVLGKISRFAAIFNAQFWAPLAKTTTAAFLLNNLVVIIERASEMHGAYLSNFRVFILSFHMFVIVFEVSLLFTIVFENPCAWLVNHFVFPEITQVIYPPGAKDIPCY